MAANTQVTLPITAIPEAQYRTLEAIFSVIIGNSESVKVPVKGNELALEMIWESVAGN